MTRRKLFTADENKLRPARRIESTTAVFQIYVDTRRESQSRKRDQDCLFLLVWVRKSSSPSHFVLVDGFRKKQRFASGEVGYYVPLAA